MQLSVNLHPPDRIGQMMISKWQWLIRQLTRTLWVRATLYGVLAVATALLAMILEPFIPEGLGARIGADALDHLLDILASSMLAVTTFSLTVMVSAYSAATTSVTPRATRLLMQDTTTQNVLSTFLGSFLFSLAGIIGLSAGVYGQSGRVVLYAVALGVIVVVVATMLRWIQHLSHFGRVDDTTERVEQAASKALGERVQHPFLGGRPLLVDTSIPDLAVPVYAQRVGYVQHLDMACLHQCTLQHQGQIIVQATPGSFVSPGSVLALVVAMPGVQAGQAVQQAFSIDTQRSFDQDPRFGLSVLAEIASRALSPAVNDPGTALDVLGRAVRVLSCCSTGQSLPEPRFPGVWVPAVDMHDMFDDVFAPIARDGAALFEVQLRLQKSLLELVRINAGMFGPAAFRCSQQALQRALDQLFLNEEKDRVSSIAKQLADQCATVPGVIAGQGSQGR
jgi:uncharacterized membrane protein